MVDLMKGGRAMTAWGSLAILRALSHAYIAFDALHVAQLNNESHSLTGMHACPAISLGRSCYVIYLDQKALLGIMAISPSLS